MGMWHIWIGLDHILFLLALILPAVVRRIRETKPQGIGIKKGVVFLKDIKNDWYPVDKFKSAFWYVLKVITFFTLAHAITLTLVTFELVSLSSRVFESLIALSIAFAAFNNIIPIFKKGDWLIAFIFGLFHGFGFAEILSDIGLNGEYITLSLLGFNLGVELGHIVIIIIALPILFVIRKTRIYKNLLIYGSIFLIVIALYWFATRLYGINLTFFELIEVIIKKLSN